MATIDQIQYYQNLLILQYISKIRAYATIGATVTPALLPDANIQQLLFSTEPVSGTFEIQYDGVNTGPLNYSDSAGTIQTAVQTLVLNATVTVTGTVAAGLTFTFSAITSTVELLSVVFNTLVDLNSNTPLPTFTSIGEQLPLEIQGGFNLTTAPLAEGAQLDTLGKYGGVTRSGFGFFGPITLDDSDFLSLILMAVIRNNAGSSLASIQEFLNRFFPSVIFIVDYANMNISYLISTSIGSQDLIQLFVTEGLLPKPMGVGVSVIAAPVINEFFAFRTYDAPASVSTTPFNTYDSVDPNSLWVSYSNAF